MALWRDHAVAERQSAEISRSHLGGRDELSGRNEPWSARRDEGDAITARGALLASHADMKMADAIPQQPPRRAGVDDRREGSGSLGHLR
jgi:hypothetical protein